jgi:undecaprenyl diphosphate synthase
MKMEQNLFEVTVETCAKLGIKNLTLYAFSTENWNRPKLEVDTLMKLLISSLKKELKTLLDNNIRLNSLEILEMFTKVSSKRITGSNRKNKKQYSNGFNT